MGSPELLPGCSWRPWLQETPPPRARSFGNERPDARGRVLVTLHRAHAFANRSGRQYRYRLIALYRLREMGRPALTRSQHVDHVNGVVNDDELANLRVLGAEFHGRLHACVYEECKQVAGEWRELDYPEMWPIPANRLGPVISLRPINRTTKEPRSSAITSEVQA